MEGFLCCWIGGLIFGGAYTWRGLFSEFYGMFICNTTINANNKTRRSNKARFP